MNEIIEEYNKVSTPQELLEFMGKYIKLGLMGTNNKKYDTNDLDAFTLANEIYWNLSEPSKTLLNGYGQMFDQVEFEREWFINHGYECKCIYITFKIEKYDSYPSHAYLLYKDKENGKWYWFEHYDKLNYGIHEYESIKDLVGDQMVKHIKYTKRFNPVDETTLTKLHLYDYLTPTFGLNTKEFMKHIFSSKEVEIVE